MINRQRTECLPRSEAILYDTTIVDTHCTYVNPIECTTSRVNPNVHNELGLLMIFNVYQFQETQQLGLRYWWKGRERLCMCVNRGCILEYFPYRFIPCPCWRLLSFYLQIVVLVLARALRAHLPVTALWKIYYGRFIRNQTHPLPQLRNNGNGCFPRHHSCFFNHQNDCRSSCKTSPGISLNWLEYTWRVL